MPFLWIGIEDNAGMNSLRGLIERNSIALLSNYPNIGSPNEETLCIDPPSQYWLGHWARNQGITKSGLWNSNHVEEHYDPCFLDTLENQIAGI